MLWIVIILLIIASDRITKILVADKIDMHTSIPVIDNFFYLTYTRNKGAAWGMFQGGRYFFIALTAIVSIILFYFLFKSNNKLLKTAVAFILGGAIGNLIDRATEGSVVDFLQFYIGTYEFPNFNIADTFVVIGTFLLSYYLLFVYQEKDDKKVEGETGKIQ
ncbi:MAG: signal peptidase II [Clostridia bacterium]|nr:signal peptidase II [Clostridia bacterium]